MLTAVKAACTAHPLTVETHELAVVLADRSKLAFCDAFICAAAVRAGAAVLLTEDMNPGTGHRGRAPRKPVR